MVKNRGVFPPRVAVESREKERVFREKRICYTDSVGSLRSAVGDDGKVKAPPAGMELRCAYKPPDSDILFILSSAETACF